MPTSKFGQVPLQDNKDHNFALLVLIFLGYFLYCLISFLEHHLFERRKRL
jgi:hypothetical protein